MKLLLTLLLGSALMCITLADECGLGTHRPVKEVIDNVRTMYYCDCRAGDAERSITVSRCDDNNQKQDDVILTYCGLEQTTGCNTNPYTAAKHDSSGDKPQFYCSCLNYKYEQSHSDYRHWTIRCYMGNICD
uniref:Conotoxin Cal8.1 n=1 Tax=Californiconus californicus TaxID=1736779 RepID=CU81_CONCL|nr:RecName: Full=Conotoxin Cal8.1; AltName: Full=Conotoxin CalMKLL-1; Flags: Precursor [Californiconus californicus]ADC35041.1 conotoxin Cal MKLL-1 precursor [Californiconus californicus]